MKLTERKNLILFGLALLMLLILVTNATPARAEEQDGESKQGEELVIDLRNGYAVFPDEGCAFAPRCQMSCAGCEACEMTHHRISNDHWTLCREEVSGDE